MRRALLNWTQPACHQYFLNDYHGRSFDSAEHQDFEAIPCNAAGLIQTSSYLKLFGPKSHQPIE